MHSMFSVDILDVVLEVQLSAISLTPALTIRFVWTWWTTANSGIFYSIPARSNKARMAFSMGLPKEEAVAFRVTVSRDIPEKSEHACRRCLRGEQTPN